MEGMGYTSEQSGNTGADDSPVEPARCYVFVNELPFPPKVHGAVQLKDNKRNRRKSFSSVIQSV